MYAIVGMVIHEHSVYIMLWAWHTWLQLLYEVQVPTLGPLQTHRRIWISERRVHSLTTPLALVLQEGPLLYAQRRSVVIVSCQAHVALEAWAQCP